MYIQATAKTSYRTEIVISALLITVVLLTIGYGTALEQQGISVRRWHWENLLCVLPVVPLLFLQQRTGLPTIETLHTKRNGWRSTFLVGMVFGIVDVVVMKIILHPQPYTELPPFLQPFPYSLFLYTAGALEIELYYRMLPLTLLLLLNQWLFKGRYRTPILVVLCLITSLIEPIQQFPDGALWLVIYATVSGIAMNAWQFRSYLMYGFGGTMAVRLGHYLIWHILLGIYVQYFELG